MDLRIFESALHGVFQIPPSKSHSLRAIVLACFADGTTKLYHVLKSGDTETAVKIFSELGCTFRVLHECTDTFDLEIIPPAAGLVYAIEKSAKENFVIDCGNSGTLLYFLASIFSFCEAKSFRFVGDESLLKRPIHPLSEIFTQRNIKFSSMNNKLPLSVCGKRENRIELFLDGSFSQCISGLFLAAVIFKINMCIKLQTVGEAPYLTMTRGWLEQSGFTFKIFDCEKKYFELNAAGKNLQGFSKKIHADWSAVAFPCLAALASGSALTVIAESDTSQGDYKILDLLKQFGVRFRFFDGGFCIEERQILHAAKLDVGETPDLLPVLCAVASFAKGTSEIGNVEIARYKESDRVAVTCSELKKCGVDISATQNTVTVSGGSKKYETSETLCSYGDHRIAMMLIAFALGCKNASLVQNAGCYKISFPSFLDELKKCGARFEQYSDTAASIF